MLLDPGETDAKIQALLARRATVYTESYGPTLGQCRSRGEHGKREHEGGALTWPGAGRGAAKMLELNLEGQIGIHRSVWGKGRVF